jgi:hypothetical protein
MWRVGKLRRDCLDSKDVFLVDCGNEVYVWVGKDATSPEKKGCMGLATQYVKESGRSEDSTRVMRVVQGAETAVFKVSLQRFKAFFLARACMRYRFPSVGRCSRISWGRVSCRAVAILPVGAAARRRLRLQGTSLKIS